MSSNPHLIIKDLHTYFHSPSRQGFVHACNGVSLDIMRGETLGIVGESGSGKSITMLSSMGLLNVGPGVVSGSCEFHSRNGAISLFPDLNSHVQLTHENGQIVQVKKDLQSWQKKTRHIMRDIWSKEIAMIFQNPRQAFNPFQTVGDQIRESIMLHTNITNKKEAKEKAYYWLEKVKIDSPKLRYENYPYGMSGGMCQRAMVAMALASQPSLLIADEPTTGLDATIQSKIVDLLFELKESLQLTLVIISHDISVISRLSDKIAVMYAGNVIEHGKADEILGESFSKRHPYTRSLLGSVPSRSNVTRTGRLPSIRGEVPDAVNTPQGCRFYDRCDAKTPAVEARCSQKNPNFSQVAAEHQCRCWLYTPEAEHA
ncbi:MAG: ABC transporter ATP-binding protein [Gammaproteobacteria bacterium]|nr:ABC transporter ATP-binding protein [Gammaproteobacteria bacterium]